MKDQINVGLVGIGFMGKAHSNAYMNLNHFFDLPFKVEMTAACDSNTERLDKFCNKFDWKSKETDFHDLIERNDIDIIDICTPNAMHYPIAISAIKNKKHIICEKPIALNADEARKMWETAEENKIKHMVGFNYRRVPALQLAKQFIDEGKFGKIRHFNAVYYQDWLLNPDFPIVWRHSIKESGSGTHGDQNAHIVDLARFFVGEIEAVCGAKEIFIKERPIEGSEEKGVVTADDAAQFMAKFRNGALGSFIASRFATGKKNFLRLEVFGSKGAFSFNLERMNELNIFSVDDDLAEQGFKTILVTESVHPYINAWWPPGHIIGWEHTFIHEIKDFVEAIAENKTASPNFYDGYKCQEVLDAAYKSFDTQKWEEIKQD
ncbi:MAG: Gfo/Idh/MocA family oxidoreductase [Pelolinea sp.]|nr:Gfo/Idh/MocA family oxidoreductase [Pelolinea sp.]